MCKCLENAEPRIIGQYKEACLCKFGPIIITSKEGVETNHGWGVNFYNYKKGNDSSFAFKFCPWCGEEI